MARKRLQVTCLCGSYTFPHRLGGGKCRGCAWAESYRTIIGECCDMCNCNGDNSCDVASGLEEINYCEGHLDHLHYQPSIRLPCTIEEYMEKHYLREEE